MKKDRIIDTAIKEEKREFLINIAKGFLVAVCISIIIVACWLAINKILKIINTDYDYTCEVYFIDGGSEVMEVEEYWTYSNSDIMKFELLDGDFVYLSLNDKIVQCTSYLDE